MTEFIMVITTVEKKADAEKIAETLVNKKLAGCIQIIGPITSIYHWQNKIEKAKEFLCLIKTSEKLFKTVENAIKEIHPYETPEIIATPISKGSNPLLILAP